MWAIVMHNLEAGKFQMIGNGVRIDPDDPRYGEEVHIVPCTEIEDHLSFGAHEFNRDCACRPSVEQNCFNRTLVKHSEKVM